ncbi:hypothetical protein [Sphingobium olei]
MPRDPEGTSEAIARSRQIRVGLVQGDSDFARPAAARLLRRLAHETGARPVLRAGSTETLFKQLERGDLDLVLAPLDPKSPWMIDVTPGPPLAATGQGEARIEYYPVLRNGENRWIMQVERIARTVAESGAEQ